MVVVWGLYRPLGVLGKALEARGTGSGAPSDGRFLQFKKKMAHFYTYFGLNSYFKAMFHQAKGFKISLNVLNRINEVQVL